MSEDDFAVEGQAFVAKETEKRSVMVGEEVGGGNLGKQVVQYIADSVATLNMTPDTDVLTINRECSRLLGLANGGTTSITGYDDLTVAFRFNNGWVHVKLHDVVATPYFASIFGTQRSHVCRRQRWGNSQAEGGKDRTFPPDWKALPPVRVPPRGEGQGGRDCLCRNCSWASKSSHQPH